jgi:hypothetical protein
VLAESPSPLMVFDCANVGKLVVRVGEEGAAA